MKAVAASALLSALYVAVDAAPAVDARDVDTRFPYTGPAVPVGDWVDPTVNGNGKGFPRLVEPPAVKPSSANPTNNINVVSLAYVPGGINVHFQTPFGLNNAPTIKWGLFEWDLCNTASGTTNSYPRTPPCSETHVTQCSQFFHNIQIPNLLPNTRYFYQIQASNGTTESQVLSFKTAQLAGDPTPFSIAVLNDMGYTNAAGTQQQLVKAVDEGLAFAWHGGDLSYADDWYSGILPCQLTGDNSWPVCYNGTSSSLPNTPPAPYPSSYNLPLPAGEIPSQGGPYGGDMSVIYESNWDLWQQWLNSITSKVPYMVMPGNHEASCAEFDGGNNTLTAYLNDNHPNSSAPTSALTYYSCPASQRNFTTYQHRFRMPGKESAGVGNFWYSFDYGLVHFVSFDGETDYAYSPEYPFVRDLHGNETLPKESETYITDSGPFGAIDDDNWKSTPAYEQYQWMAADLAKVDRKKTPWVIAMSHRPMYSTATSGYQKNIRNAFQGLFLEHGVDAYFAGHIHWYERLWPLTANGSVDHAAIINDNTYRTNPGTSFTMITNGMAGNIESHSTLYAGEKVAPITAVLNQADFGFSKLTVVSATELIWQYVKGDGSGLGDELKLVKNGSLYF